MNDSLRQDIESYVKECMKNYDASHDFFHILRVRNLSIHIAKQEKVKDVETLQLIELCAYLHDINDHKYQESSSKSQNKMETLKEILRKHNIISQNDESYLTQLLKIIENVSFSKEQKLIAAYDNASSKSKDNKNENKSDNDNNSNNNDNINVLKYKEYMNLINKSIALRIIQDADRIDAIGAIGIARTFTFSGCRNRAMFNFIPNYIDLPIESNNGNDENIENKSNGNENNNGDFKGIGIKKDCNVMDINQWIEKDLCKDTCIGHFFDKLLILKDLMKTKTGQDMAIERTNFMKLFVNQFCKEWNLTDSIKL